MKLIGRAAVGEWTESQCSEVKVQAASDLAMCCRQDLRLVRRQRHVHTDVFYSRDDASAARERCRSHRHRIPRSASLFLARGVTEVPRSRWRPK